MIVVLAFIGAGCYINLIAFTLTGQCPWYVPFIPIAVVVGIAALGQLGRGIGYTWRRVFK